MHVFLIVIIPLMYAVAECICNNRKIDREQMTCIFTGLVIVSIYALIDFFAIGSSHMWINTFSSVWLHYLITETVIPIVICIIPIIIARDDIRVKVRCLLPVLAAFYAVFVPYKVLSAGASPDVFVMVLYPLLMAAMLFNIDTAASVFVEGEDVSVYLPIRCVVACVSVIAGLLLPSVFAAAYFLKRAGVLIWLLFALFIVSTAGLRASAMLFLKTSPEK